MGKYESELTRRYLLNSNSRGSLEEVVTNDAAEDGGVLCGDDEACDEGHMGNHQFMKEWEGRVTTHAYFRQSYE
ncbi:hypothetical protein [uncultured Paenibacillus sp.]|uniref:hypothetical protein n=1 Tax=uncultured Paenibacillus sp. TaxID=227322 RepID=UPI0015A8B978|nr:hypothetical protein [uncultured Paenibacillus sp.]GJM83913.1 hypothetical protein HMSSN139_64090 [Paenibacillus sp. HMSSN-139]